MAKQLSKAAVKSEKEEKSEKLKVKKAMEKGNMEVRSCMHGESFRGSRVVDEMLLSVAGCQDLCAERYKEEERAAQLHEAREVRGTPRYQRHVF